MSDLQQVDPNLYAAQQALGPGPGDDASPAEQQAYEQQLLEYSASLDASNPAGASPLGPTGSPGDPGGPPIPGDPTWVPGSPPPSTPGTTTPPPAPTGPGVPSPTNPINPITGLTAQQTQAQQAQSAKGVITAFLSQVPGLASLDPTGVFANWVSTQASALAGQGLSSGDIVNQIESTMNNPGATGDQAAQAVFDAVFPGYNTKIQNGTTNSDGSYTGIAGYIQYSAQLQQFSQQAGLVPGTINQQAIGNLWAGNVSSNEVSQRVTDAVVATTSAPKPVQDYLAANYGMGPGELASYYLNPTNTLQQITQNLNAGMVGGAAQASGFDTSLSTSRAQALGAFLANGTSGGNGGQIGVPNSVGFEQATNAFTSSLGSNQAGGQLGSAAQMAAAGYTTANLPGQTGGTVGEDTLVAAIEGNATALQQTSAAQQNRTAGSHGGGGVTASAKGVGIGFAQD